MKLLLVEDEPTLRAQLKSALEAADYVVDEADAPGVVEAVIAEMRTPPTWGLDIPLDAEGGIGYSYGDAK